ncbi:MAG: DNA recombination protein RmuC [Clostridiales bacterium]|nr:DNA recombination protein RmuC [Clostridiales bacterium]OPZ69311.1 MAG: RmuC family protein [Firmicutes bacterium ADurb.Bin467]
MLEFINGNPGLAALFAGALVLLAVFLLEAGRRGANRRLNRELAERQERATLLLHQALQGSARQVAELSNAMEARQDRLRATLDERLDALTKMNDQKLERMRETVAEKLQTTLEGRLGESFKLVNEQLSRVHKGLGEMQTLAAGVGDLKKVLTNVKTRGVWGEVRLRALLEQNLAPGQYVENAQVCEGSAERVEFAVRLPSAEGEGPLLPIDSKFPQEDYLRLVDASNGADVEALNLARSQLSRAVTEQAKRIADKYVKPPQTTDFAILFLPVESLYAEVVRIDGLTENIQNRHRVLVSGPSTFSALLTSLQMGFRTCALEKRSGEVLKLLAAVRAEFQKYGEAVQKARTRLEQAGSDLDAIDTRTRAINRRLRDIGEGNGTPEGNVPSGLDEPGDLN